MNGMIWASILVLSGALCVLVNARSVQDGVHRKPLSNIVQSAEWDTSGIEVRRKLILRGSPPQDTVKDEKSLFMIKLICQRCMANNNLHCVSELCLVNSRPQTSLAPSTNKINNKNTIVKNTNVKNTKAKNTNVKNTKVNQEAFATGTSQHADILCSLCKSKGDILCTMRLCANPNRDEILEDDDEVECTDGVCRWQLQRSFNTGFSNGVYNTWWQPTSWYIWFEDVAKEIGYFYQHVVSPIQKLLS